MSCWALPKPTESPRSKASPAPATSRLDVHAVGPIKNTDAMTFSGSGALQNASLKMPSLTQPVNIRNVNMQFTQNSVNLTNLAASLGSTNASGSLSMANFQAPRLTFALSADKLNVAELQKDHGQLRARSGQERKPRLPGAWFPPRMQRRRPHLSRACSPMRPERAPSQWAPFSISKWSSPMCTPT